MAPQIFITGITGYIGGQILHRMTTDHPEYQLTGLVRSEEQKQKIIARYPAVKVALGDLDSDQVILEQSKPADVVIQAANSDHLGAIRCIIQGLSEGQKNGAYIQLSGAASIMDISAGFGQPTARVWDDEADFETISTFDQTHLHAHSDQLVLSEGKKSAVRTVLFEPPMIFGKGEGIKARGLGLPVLVSEFKKRGKAFTVGEGKSIISTLHVNDAADVLVRFTEAALSESGDGIEWGGKCIYYAENGDVTFRDMVEAIAKQMVERGDIKTTEIESLTPEAADGIHMYGSLLFGWNIRIRATKLRSLGWAPKQPPVLEMVSEFLE